MYSIPRLPLLVAALAFGLSLLPAMAEEEPIVSFDFAQSTDTDQTGGRTAAFFDGESPSPAQVIESDGKYALSFNGKQALVLPAKGVSFGEGGFAIEAVVRVRNFPAHGNAVIASQAGRFFFAIRPDGALTAQLLTLPARTVLSSSGKDKLVPEVWHTVGLIYDGTQTLLFINGMVVAQHESPRALAGSSNPILLGARFANPGDFSSGSNRLKEGLDGELASLRLFRNESKTAGNKD